MPQIDTRVLHGALDLMGQAHGQMIANGAAVADRHLAEMPPPQITTAPADANNMAQPAPLPVPNPSAPLDNPKLSGV